MAVPETVGCGLRTIGRHRTHSSSGAGGFAAGQCGDNQAVYCGDHDELSDRFPALQLDDDAAAVKRLGGEPVDAALRADILPKLFRAAVA
jgi:hypothetical protein